MERTHIPVLVDEVLHYLNPRANENFIDVTVGEGGHTIEILKRIEPNGRVLGIDADKQQVENSSLATKEFGDRRIITHGSYANVKGIAEREKFNSVQGILLDLGMSSWQLEDSGRGFTFLKDEPLDMRYSTDGPLTAVKIVNQYPEGEIARIIREYGEEKFAKQIANKIVTTRQIQEIKTTHELVEILGKAIPKRFHRGGIHYATRTFQALRIAVNHELLNLETFLPRALEVLAPGGRLVIISFHSLEDRIVKNFFKHVSDEGAATLLTKKPISAEASETIQNPRARSAKLRAIIKK